MQVCSLFCIIYLSLQQHKPDWQPSSWSYGRYCILLLAACADAMSYLEQEMLFKHFSAIVYFSFLTFIKVKKGGILLIISNPKNHGLVGTRTASHWPVIGEVKKREGCVALTLQRPKLQLASAFCLSSLLANSELASLPSENFFTSYQLLLCPTYSTVV